MIPKPGYLGLLVGGYPPMLAFTAEGRALWQKAVQPEGCPTLGFRPQLLRNFRNHKLIQRLQGRATACHRWLLPAQAEKELKEFVDSLTFGISSGIISGKVYLSRFYYSRMGQAREERRDPDPPPGGPPPLPAETSISVGSAVGGGPAHRK